MSQSLGGWTQPRQRWSQPPGSTWAQAGSRWSQPEAPSRWSTIIPETTEESKTQTRWPPKAAPAVKARSRLSQPEINFRWSIPVTDLSSLERGHNPTLLTTPLPPGSGPVSKQHKGKSWRFYVAFFALAVVAFASALDATSLSIALPIVAKDLNGTSLQSFWAGISFLLTSVLFQPVATSCSDIFGRKPVLYVCLGFFGVGAIVFGSAHDMKILILGRTIQGMGGGGIEALCEIILTDMTTLRERALWIGLLGFVWAAGSVLGPLVGGAFSEYVSWRWVAWINLPLIGISVVLIPPFLTLNTIRLSMKQKLKQLDYIGILLFIAGMTIFVIALTWGGVLYPWKSYKTLVPLILGLAILGVFVWWESKPAVPMIPYRIFAVPTAALALFCAVLHGIILYGVLFYLPLYFEGVTGDRPLRAAVEAFPLSLTVTPFAVLSAFAIDYVRRYCWASWTGWTFVTVGMGLMSLLALHTDQAGRSGLQIVAGIGLGILYPALSIPLQAAVEVDDNGLAIGTFVFSRQLGSVIGLALGSAIFTNQFDHYLPNKIPDELTPLKVGNAAVDFVSVLRTFGLDQALLDSILEAYVQALRYVWIAMVAIGGVGFIASLFMKDISLESEEEGRQAFHEE